MAIGRFFREDFDREREFVATRFFVFAGDYYHPGQGLNKALFTVRRLRQLYDRRFVSFAPDPVEVVPVETPAYVQQVLDGLNDPKEPVVPKPEPVEGDSPQQSPPPPSPPLVQEPVVRRRRRQPPVEESHGVTP